jgi:hypothetical protein
MNWIKNLFCKKAQKQCAISGVVRSYLPKEGSIYTHNKKGSAYNGMTGVVKHHYCGTRFMIECETGVLCNIKP